MGEPSGRMEGRWGDRRREGQVSGEGLLALAMEASHAAGKLLLERFRGPVRGLATKSSPTDVVSDADRDSERLLVELIRRHRPGDGIVSEEGGDKDTASGLTWVIDPLDGTVNFLYGRAEWCVSVAAEDARGAVVGVVHDPISGETFFAERGGGAHLDGDLIAVSDEADLSQALIGTGFSYDPATRAAQSDGVPRVLRRVRDLRRAGSAALDLAAVACGRLDGFFEADMKAWDRSAGELIIREAGGLVTPLPAPIGTAGGVIASGPALHEQLVALVHGSTSL
jgi:myo-inositol-1(or 4)-monophosphatase